MLRFLLSFNFQGPCPPLRPPQPCLSARSPPPTRGITVYIITFAVVKRFSQLFVKNFFPRRLASASLSLRFRSRFAPLTRLNDSTSSRPSKRRSAIIPHPFSSVNTFRQNIFSFFGVFSGSAEKQNPRLSTGIENPYCGCRRACQSGMLTWAARGICRPHRPASGRVRTTFQRRTVAQCSRAVPTRTAPSVPAVARGLRRVRGNAWRRS